jgi:Xaa-Pro dipeptidase
VPFSQKLQQTQAALATAGVDGWLLYDFRRVNDLACDFLEIPPTQHLSRRFFYWIPAKGAPIKICNAIEPHSLNHLPGDSLSYRSWQELENRLKQILSGSSRIAMEYSPRNAIPYVSKVDAGTLEMVRDSPVEIVSSADFLQTFSSVWTNEQLQQCRAAGAVLQTAVERAWQWLALMLQQGEHVTDYDVQQYLLNEFAQAHCMTDNPPICAINADSANPHYSPQEHTAKRIKAGDFVLLDLFCKQDVPQAVYADIAQVGVAASQPTPRQQQIFAIVREARDAATDFVRQRFSSGEPIYGYEVDEVARGVITKAGYGDYFIHRTGHSLGASVHGSGANIDNLETKDHRELLKGSCFTIEPGIYLPGEFGIRLEYDIFAHRDGRIEIIGGIQPQIRTLL